MSPVPNRYRNRGIAYKPTQATVTPPPTQRQKVKRPSWATPQYQPRSRQRNQTRIVSSQDQAISNEPGVVISPHFRGRASTAAEKAAAPQPKWGDLSPWIKIHGQGKTNIPPEGSVQPISAVPYGFRIKPTLPEKRFTPDYEPSYWENPVNVAQWRNRIKAGEVVPDWVDPAAVNQAYDYMSYANGGAADTGWKWLNPDDPGRGWLQTLTQPGIKETITPAHWGEIQAYNLAQRTPDTWTDEEIAELNPNVQEEYKSYKEQYANTVPKSELPIWQQIIIGAQQNPWVMAAGQGVWGGPYGIALAEGLTAIQQYMPGSPSEKFATNAMLLMNKPWEYFESAMGTALQYIDPERPYIGSDFEKMAKEFQAAWQAGRVTGESQVAYGMDPTRPLTGGAGGMGLWLGQRIGEQFGLETLPPGYGVGGRFDILNGLAMAELAAKSVAEELGYKNWPGDTKIAGLNQSWIFEPFQAGTETRWSANPVDVGITGMAGLVDLRRNILKGGDPNTLVNEFIARQGWGGMINELAYSIALDPLNVMPGLGSVGVVKPIAKALGADTVAKAFSRFAGPYENFKYYKNLLQTGAAGAADELSGIQKFLGGLTKDGKPKFLEVDTPKSVIGRAYGWMFGLTPSSKARLSMGWSSEGMGTVALKNMDSPDKLIRDLDVIGTKKPSEAAQIAGYYGSPEMYSQQRTYAGFLETAHNKLNEYNSDPMVQMRDRLKLMADAVGLKREDVLKLIDQANDPATALAKLNQLAQVANTPRSTDLVRAFTDKEITADHIGAMKEAFTGDHPAPWNSEHFAVDLYNAFEDHAGKYLTQAYGLHPDNAVLRFASVLKKGQGLLLLGLNPTYLFNNAFNNFLMRASGGVFGFISDKKIGDYFTKLGMEPYRLSAGIGAADVMPEGKIMHPQIGEEGKLVPTGAGEVAIRGAGTKKVGSINFMDRALTSANKLGVISEVSRALESAESRRAFYYAHNKAWNGLWKRGDGFRIMRDPRLVDALREIDPNLPETIYRSIEGARSEKEVVSGLNTVFNRSKSYYAVEQVLPDVARMMGVDPKILKDTLGPVYDDLARDIASVKPGDTAGIMSVFRRTSAKAQDYIDRLNVQDITTRAQEAAQLAKTEGWAQGYSMLNEQSHSIVEFWKNHDQSWQETFDLADMMVADGAPWEQVNAIYREQHARQNRNWQRMRSFETGTFKGIMEAWGMDEPNVREFVHDLGRRSDTWTGYYNTVEKMRRDYFKDAKNLKPDERKAAWALLEKETNEMYRDTITKTAEINQSLDKRFIETVRFQFGDDAANMAKSYRERMAELDRARAKLVQTQRQSVEGLSLAEKRAANEEFYTKTYPVFIQKYFQTERQLAAALYKKVTGQAVPADRIPPEMVRALTDMGFRPDEIQRMTPEEAADYARPRTQQELEAFWNDPNRVGLRRPPEPGAEPVPAQPTPPPTEPGAPPEAIPAPPLESFDDLPPAHAQTLEIAKEYGFPVTDSLSGDKDHLVALLRKYGEDDIKNMPQHQLWELPEERIRQVFENRKVQKAEETAAAELKKALAILEKEDIWLEDVKDLESPHGQFVRRSIIELPEKVQTEVKTEAHLMDLELPTESKTYAIMPDSTRIATRTHTWYSDLNAETGLNSKTASNILRHIVEGDGKDIPPSKKDVNYKKVKEVLLARLLEGQPETMKWYGYTDEEIRARIVETVGGTYDQSLLPDLLSNPPEAYRPYIEAYKATASPDEVVRQVENSFADLQPPRPRELTPEEGQQAIKNVDDLDDSVITRESFREMVVDKWLDEVDNRPYDATKEEMAEAYMQLTDAVAQSWAEVTGRTPEEWYIEHLAGTRKGLNGEEAYFQGRNTAPGSAWYYSQLEETVKKIPQEKLSSDQLKALVKKGGVKDAELEEINFYEWLSDHPKTTRTEALEYIRDHKIMVEEVVLGDITDARKFIDASEGEVNAAEDAIANRLREMNLDEQSINIFWDSTYDEMRSVVGNDLVSAYERAIDYRSNAIDGFQRPPQTRWSNLALPGGQKYRELVLTLPAKTLDTMPLFDAMRARKWDIREHNRGWVLFDTDNNVPISPVFGHPTEAMDYTRRELGSTPKGDIYKSGHWTGIDNPLAHVRFDERIDADGARVLFMEELQSDWGQQMRMWEKRQALEKEQRAITDEWAKAAEADPTIQDLNRQLQELYARRDELDKQALVEEVPDFDLIKSQFILEREGLKTELSNANEKIYQKFAKRLEDLAGQLNQAKIVSRPPDAPFLKTWDTLVVKRMLRWATENGFEKVAFPTGPQAARIETHPLVTDIEAIRLWSDGSFQYMTRGEGGWKNVDIEPTKTLDDYIGADAAKQLREQEISAAEDTEATFQTLETSDIVFGGEKMRWFYDRDLINKTNAYLKRWGTKVEETKIETNPNRDIPEWLYEGTERPPSQLETVHSIKITPEMKDDIMRGQALFQGEKGAVSFLEDGRALLHVLQDPDITTLPHELFHIFLRDIALYEKPIIDKLTRYYAEKGVEVGFDQSYPGPLVLSEKLPDGWTVKGNEFYDERNILRYTTKEGDTQATSIDNALYKYVNEIWAEDSELYLREGRAPTPGLRGAFESFSRWIAKLVGHLMGDGNYKLSPYIRDVFDRILTVHPDAEDAPARPIMPEPQLPGMPKEQLVSQRAPADVFQPERAEGVTKIMPGFEEAYAPRAKAREVTGKELEGLPMEEYNRGNVRPPEPTPEPEPAAPIEPAAPGEQPTPAIEPLGPAGAGPDRLAAGREPAGSALPVEPGGPGEVGGRVVQPLGRAEAGALPTRVREGKSYLSDVEPPAPTHQIQNQRVLNTLRTEMGQTVDLSRIMSAYDRGDRGYVLANGTGTGKTYLIHGLIDEGNFKRVLVVTRNNSLISQASEVAPRFDQTVKKVNSITPSKEGEVQYMTYDGLSDLVDQNLTGNYDLIVFDESQSLKNYWKGTIKTANAAVQMMGANPNAKVLFSSATPFQGLPEMKYMEPLGLWKDFGEFLFDHNYTWVEPKNRMMKGYWRFDGRPEDILGVYKEMTQRGLASWRDLQMDAKLENNFVRVPLRADVQTAYNQANRLFDAAVGSVRNGSLINAQRTAVLRRLMEMSKVDDAIKLAKQELAAGRQVAIFTGYYNEAKPPQFKSDYYRYANDYLSQVYDLVDTTETKSIQKLVDELGGKDKVALFYGDVSDAVKDKEKAAYNSGKKKVLVATTESGGVGLSLHDTTGNAPRSQININIPWSGQSFQQVAGRSYRFGSKSDVKQYWLFSDTPKEAAIAKVIGTRLSEMHALVKGVATDADNTKIQAFDFGLMEKEPDKYLGTGAETFFQSARPEPTPKTNAVGPNPPGTAETIAAPMYTSQLEGDLWNQKVTPILDNLQNEIVRRGPISGKEDLPPDMKDRFAAYQDMVSGDLATARMTTLRWAENVRDYALLNYSRRTNADNLLGLIYPYQFWFTRTAMNFMSRAIDKPAWFANWARLRNFQNAFHLQGFPSRLDNKIEIPAAWLPEWAGTSMFVDPIRKAAPFEDIFINPITQAQQEKTDEQRAAEYVLLSQVQNGQITEAQAREAATSQEGEIWNTALAQATADQDMTSDMSWLNTIMQPALYLTLPYFMMTGKNWNTGRDDMPLLPITRTGLGLQASTKGTPLQMIGDFVGGILAAPETAIRRKAGLQEFGDWGDYYIDREIANMVADGTATTQEGLMAMTQKSGPTYDEAKARAKYEIGVAVPGAWPIQATLKEPWKHPGSFIAAMLFGWLPAGLLPKGELEQRGLGLIYKNAREAYNKGDPQALNDFFEKHPEYEARLALYDTPEERLRQFLISEVWDKYSAMGSFEKQQVREQMGDDFQNLFLDKTNRNYNEIDSKTLAMWAQQMGGAVPRTETTTPVIDNPDFPQLDMAPEADAKVINTYRDVRNKLYPNWYAMQTWYYSFPKGSQQRKDVLKQFPQLKEYWDWNKSYKAAHPQIEQYQTDTAKLGAAADYSYLQQVSPITIRQLYAYYNLDQALTTGAEEELFNLYQQLGEPGGSFEAFLEYTRAGLAP